MESGNNSTIRDMTSFNISLNDTTINLKINRNIHKEEEFNSILKNIKKIFIKNIQPLRENFNIDSYETYAREIRNNVIKLRKMYYILKKKYEEMQNQNQNQYQNNIRNGQDIQIILPSARNSNIELQEQSNSNTITNTNTNTNTNANTEINNNNINTILRKKNLLDETTMSQQVNRSVQIIEPEGINGLYIIFVEIVNFLLCYDDIYINYKNKSAFVTLKLFLYIATLHFLKNISKSDFIFCLMNKSCNILCQYSEMQKTDESIRKILSIEEIEINKIKKYFKYDSELINKISKVIEKFNLIKKIEKVNQDINSKKLFNNGDIIPEPKDEMQLKINKLNQELSILNDLQDSFADNYKMFLKDSINNELEQFNMLINKISTYEAPLIKQKFIDIIFRNKEVFKYLNENILYRHIPRKIINEYSLYPFNKNLSIYNDKYLITGKNILNILSISLDHENINEILRDLEKFSNEFLNNLANIKNNENEDNSQDKNNQNMNNKEEKSNSKSDDKKNMEGKDSQNKEAKNKKNLLFTICEINYYHLVLFSYMISSKMKDREEFYRINALVSTNQFEDIYTILGNLEKIDVKGNNFDGKEKTKFLLFNYENVSKNNISFLLEQKKEVNEDKNKKKKVEPISQVEFCSSLAKKLFQDDPIIIILTIALKHWAIQRKIFKKDFTIGQRSHRIMLDDSILLYLIYYFLMHKGIREEFLIIKKNKKNLNEVNEENEANKKKVDNPKEKAKEGKIKEKGIDEKKVLLKELGELFVEFFWFIHELIKITEEEKNKEKTISIDLSKKNYTSKTLIFREIEETKYKQSYSIPISLELCYDKNKVLFKIDKKQANILKRECTRALYFLLNKDGEELFVMEIYQ